MSLAAGSLAAHAQEPGDVLWSVPINHRDAHISTTVGPDGTIYVHSDALYAVSPDGSGLWTRDLFGTYPVSVGSDGTVYSGTIGGLIRAYAPDGTQRWTFDADHTTIAGPTVGPDGNVYVITEFGLGAYSLTPDGTLRWNVAGFTDFDGTQAQPIPFSAGQLYHSTAETVPGDACGAGVRGMVALSLDGDLRWCVPLTIASHPAVSPAGDVYVTNGIAELRSYAPDGGLRWFFGFPNPGSAFGLLEPAVGPDGDAYQFLSAELWGVDGGGNLLWSIDPTDGNVISPMAVAPDDAVLVAGFARSGGQAGVVAGLDPETGASLWTVMLAEGERVTGRVVFSHDGNVVYVPVSTLSASRLLAIQADASDVAVVATLVGGPIAIPPTGGSFDFTVTLTNTTGQAQTFEAWSEATGPVNRSPLVGPRAVTLPPGASVSRTLTQRVPGVAPAGLYTYTVNVGTFGSAVSASDSFPVAKDGVGLGPRSGGEASDWSVRGWDEAVAASRSDTLPVGFALSAAYPNPFNRSAEMTLEVAEAQHVTVVVFDAVGRQVEVLHDGRVEAGSRQSLAFEAPDLPSGVYVVRAVGEALVESRRVAILR